MLLGVDGRSGGGDRDQVVLVIELHGLDVGEHFQVVALKTYAPQGQPKPDFVIPAG